MGHLASTLLFTLAISLIAGCGSGGSSSGGSPPNEGAPPDTIPEEISDEVKDARAERNAAERALMHTRLLTDSELFLDAYVWISPFFRGDDILEDFMQQIKARAYNGLQKQFRRLQGYGYYSALEPSAAGQQFEFSEDPAAEEYQREAIRTLILILDDMDARLYASMRYYDFQFPSAEATFQLLVENGADGRRNSIFFHALPGLERLDPAIEDIETILTAIENDGAVPETKNLNDPKFWSGFFEYGGYRDEVANLQTMLTVREFLPRTPPELFDAVYEQYVDNTNRRYPECELEESLATWRQHLEDLFLVPEGETFKFYYHPCDELEEIYESKVLNRVTVGDFEFLELDLSGVGGVKIYRRGALLTGKTVWWDRFISPHIFEFQGENGFWFSAETYYEDLLDKLAGSE